MAVIIKRVVVRQIFDFQLSFAVLKQVAEFRAELQTTAGQQARGNSRVIILRNIPVIRDTEFIAATTGAADFRC